MNKGFRRAIDIAKKLAFFVGIVIVWQLYIQITSTPEYLFPTPLKTVESLIANNHILFSALLITLEESLAGFALSILVGFGIAVVIVYSKYLRATLYPALIAFNSFPKVLLAPLFIIWFGFGELPKIVLAFLFAFFPIAVNVTTGLGEIDHSFLDLARIMKASDFQVFRKIRLPNSIPYLFDGLIIAFPIALVGAVIGELTGGNIGLGYLVELATSLLNTPEMFATFVLMIIVSVAIFYVLIIARNIALKWKTASN